MDFLTKIHNGSGFSSSPILLPATAAALHPNMLSVRGHVNHYLNEHYWLTIMFSVVLAGAVVVGVIGNIMVIIAVVIDKFLWQPANLLVINMALADIVIAGVLDPFNIMGVVYGYAFFEHREWLCGLVGSICAPVCTASLFNYSLIAVNRYVRICKPHNYSAIYTWRNTIIMCVLIWIYGVTMHVPNHVGWGSTDHNPKYYICSFDIQNSYSYLLFWVVMTVVLPFVIVAVMYSLIFMTVRKSNLRIIAHKYAPESLQFELTIAKSGSYRKHESVENVDSQRERDELKLMRTLFIIIVVFLLCWGLFVLLTTMGSPDWVPGWLFVLCIFTAHVQCALNPIVYCITNSSNFRSAFEKIVCLRFSE